MPSAPERELYPVPLGKGVWDESSSPITFGSNGMVAFQNGVYQREGSWGKRTGLTPVYFGGVTPPVTGITPTGIRWYRGLPTALTQTVIVGEGNVFIGGDPFPSKTGPWSNLTQFAPLDYLPTPAMFAPTNDPAINPGATPGGDVLIFTGGVFGPFQTAALTFGLSGTPAAGNTVTITFKYGSATTTVGPYTVLQTDNLASIGSALATLINSSAAVFYDPDAGYLPYLNQCVTINNPDPTNPNTQVIYVGALTSGTGGNSITGAGAVTGGGVGITPSSTTNFVGGGETREGPIKYDGNGLTGVSYQMQYLTKNGGAFTGCVTWHDHVWYWGDPSAPDTLFASDIDQPEQFTFMIQNGGYTIGAGDGDPTIRNCIPIGNILYVFKGQNIYAITGYDFQSGEYEFDVQSAIIGHGIPSSQCVSVLNNALVFWDGKEFCRLAVGSYQVEIIGQTIPITSARIASSGNVVLSCVSGSFPVNSALPNSYVNPPSFQPKTIYSNVAMWSIISSAGEEVFTLVYDDQASQRMGNYAWSLWKFGGGLPVTFMPFGTGQNNAGNGVDQSELMLISAATNTGLDETFIYVSQLGADAYSDYIGTDFDAIPTEIGFLAQTGWVTIGTLNLVKNLHRIFLNIEATPGATIYVNVISSGPLDGSALSVYPQQLASFQATVGTTGVEAFQSIINQMETYLPGYAFMFTFTEAAIGTAYELCSLGLDAIQEALRP